MYTRFSEVALGLGGGMGVGTQWRGGGGWEGGLRFRWTALNSLPGMASALMTNFKTT